MPFDVTPKILEALAFGLKAANVVTITLEECQNCINAILARVNPPVDGPVFSSAPLSDVCGSAVDKAVERLEAE